MTVDRIDPATLAVMQNALRQIVNEMDLALEKAAFTPIMSEAATGPTASTTPPTGRSDLAGRYRHAHLCRRHAVRGAISPRGLSGPGSRRFVMLERSLSWRHPSDGR